ncbi:MAG: phosphate/phosphite/phosphonate ABC transporter substrate-binding protein [Megasphaera sp.]|jgi:phosphonate transport system substrate-binding protein|nr:phosphate/phosphite/phosphonate ABC transporter substrate-binding protein [Megasphaera sp.]
MWAFLMLAIVCLLLYCTGCGTPQGKIDFTQSQENPAVVDNSGEKPLRIAFASVMSPKETRQSYQILVNYISQQSHHPVVLLQRRTYEELNTLMSNGDADIAFFSTGAYAAYRGKTPIELMAMVQTNGMTTYRTYVIVAADSDISSFEGLRNHVFAFTDPLSYSGRLSIDFLLHEQGNASDYYFKRFFYTYSHDKSIWAVANHLADGASVDSQIYDYIMQTNPKLGEQVRILTALPEAPTGPVVLRSDMPEAEKKQMRRIFYSMDSVPSLQDALKNAVIDKFVPPDPMAYEGLRTTYRQISNASGD